MVSDPSAPPVRTAETDPETEAETESTDATTATDSNDASRDADGARDRADAESVRHRLEPAPGRRAAGTTADAAPEEGYACPLCGFSHGTRNAVYAHLVASHRKRAISSALLERQANGPATE